MLENGHKNGVKLPFIAPKLQVYGTARDITRNIGKSGSVDGPPVAKAATTKLSYYEEV